MFLPAQDGRDGLALMSQFMSPPAFPITPEGLAGSWTFSAMEPGTFETDDFAVTATEITHKGGRTFGYRIEHEGASIGFAPDHAPALGVSAHTIETLAEVDVLIHDAQFLEALELEVEQHEEALEARVDLGVADALPQDVQRPRHGGTGILVGREEVLAPGAARHVTGDFSVPESSGRSSSGEAKRYVPAAKTMAWSMAPWASARSSAATARDSRGSRATPMATPTRPSGS